MQLFRTLRQAHPIAGIDTARRPFDTLRLAFAFVALVVLVILSLESWRLWRDYHRAYELAQITVTNLTRATRQHAEDAIREVDGLTAGIIERIQGDGLAHMNVPRLHELLKQQVKIMPQLAGLFVYGADGQWLVTSQDRIPPNANNADREYFIYHRTHPELSVHIGAVIASRSTGELVIPVSRRLNNPDGSFAGVFLGTLSVQYFLDYYAAFKVDDRSVFLLALRDGTLLARRPFDTKLIGTNLSTSALFSQYLSQADEGVAEVRSQIDGVERLYSYRSLNGYPLIVDAGMSRDTILRPWYRDLLRSLAVVGTLLLGLLLLGAGLLRELRGRQHTEDQLRAAHLALEEMALQDSLTGLGNRRRLDQRLPEEIARAQREGTSLALIMLDIDHFKRFNDRYGHPAGDACLREVAGAIRAALRRPADLAVRYGGEEMTVLLPATGGPGACQVAEAILQNIRALGIPHADHPGGQVTASAGVFCCAPGRHPSSASGMLKAADAALYMAKHSGRDQWRMAGVDGLFSATPGGVTIAP
ncbi:diguanylate cyclase [Pseudomonas sp. NPDC007930]|uniref:sensor domain-containing diguanylate cyclase n=1 Tax=Pseudomonas sp. NPDC007930 TaxID=3364417 RepID=UPI0036E2332F